MRIQERFENAIEELYQNNYYLAGEVTKLGYPKYSNGVPTAGVAWDKEKNKVIFLFNKEFESTLNDDEFRMVVAHETMHVLNLHIFLFCDKVQEMKRKNKTDEEIGKFINKLNIAADCICNDSLTNLYGMERLVTFGTTKQFVKGVIKDVPLPVWYGLTTVMTDTEDMTAMEVYYILPEKAGECGHTTWASFMDGDGKLSKDFIDAVGNMIGRNLENSSLSDEELKKIDEIRKQMKESGNSQVSQAGRDTSSHMKSIDGLSSNTLNWNKILHQFVETKKIRDVWNRPNRKLMAVYPDIILPSSTNEEREEIFVAIDVSGSIDHKAYQLFMSVVKNVPYKFKVTAITFDTTCCELDLKKNTKVKVGGGTEFGIIENYINNELKRYPKAIFVLTDGDNWDGPLSPRHPDRWCWLLYGSNRKDNISHMKTHDIFGVLK